MVEFFGTAFLRGVTSFPVLELVNELGIGAFEDGRAELAAFRLRELFRAADPDGTVVAFRHAAFQEALAAEVLRSPEGRDAALASGAPPRLTEQVREFLASGGVEADYPGECVLPAGVYLVGPGHHLMLRRIERPVVFDRFPVTVARYKTLPRRGGGTGIGAVGPPGHAGGLYAPAVAGAAAGPGVLRGPGVLGSSGDRGQLVERLRVRPVRGQAAADFPGMGGRGAGA